MRGLIYHNYRVQWQQFRTTYEKNQFLSKISLENQSRCLLSKKFAIAKPDKSKHETKSIISIICNKKKIFLNQLLKELF